MTGIMFAISAEKIWELMIENVINHGDICDGSYSCIQVQVGTIHHDAETTQVWVVDKPAYTEYVYGEKCSVCGATK